MLAFQKYNSTFNISGFSHEDEFQYHHYLYTLLLYALFSRVLEVSHI